MAEYMLVLNSIAAKDKFPSSPAVSFRADLVDGDKFYVEKVAKDETIIRAFMTGYSELVSSSRFERPPPPSEDIICSNDKALQQTESRSEESVQGTVEYQESTYSSGPYEQICALVHRKRGEAIDARNLYTRPMLCRMIAKSRSRFSHTPMDIPFLSMQMRNVTDVFGS
jgi:hypothetical protein